MRCRERLEITGSIIAPNALCGAGNGPGSSIDPVAEGKGCPSEICAAQSLLRLFFRFSMTCTKTQRLSQNFIDLAEILAIEILAI